MGVADYFRSFCSKISIPQTKRSSIATRYENITQRLNKDYWGSESKTNHSRYVGSYGRGTAINSFSDLDMIFKLPYGVYERFNSYSGNGQSALLQEVRNAIKKTYSVTDVGADGQVVVVPFNNGIIFEVVPAFINKDGRSYTYPNANSGGSWKVTDPVPEIEAISKMDSNCNYNLKNLCRMMRAWKNTWNVPMGGLLIDTFSHNFLKNWDNRDKSYVYYDYMSRDFLKYVSNIDDDQLYWLAIGSNQKIYNKGKFAAKAKKCHNLSLEAIDKESNGYSYSAKQKWGEIYGTNFPS